MEQFLAERYVAHADVARDNALVRQLATVARVRLVQTVYVPEDELCLYLFEGESAAAVARLGAFDRISAAVLQ